MDDQPRLELTGSRLFTAWLAGAKASLAFTTYQAGKLFLIGLRPDGRLSIFERSFPRCMGLGSGPGGTIWMSSLYQLWRLENFLEPGATKDGHDAVYVPVTGTPPATSTFTTSRRAPTAAPSSSPPASTASPPPPSGRASRPSGARPSSTGWRPRTAAT
jgi:hypothetical protein